MDKSWKDHKYAAEPEITVNSCPEVSDQTQKMLRHFGIWPDVTPMYAQFNATVNQDILMVNFFGKFNFFCFQN